MTPEQRIRKHLSFLYGDQAGEVWTDLEGRLRRFAEQHPELGEALPPSARLSQRDAILITYGDQFQPEIAAKLLIEKFEAKNPSMVELKRGI